MGLLYPLWTGVTLMLVFFFWMVSRTSPIRTDTGSLYKWQAIMITLYSLYIAVVILVMALTIIALFNYYYAVARGESFKKRFLEMAILSFTVAGISFLIGYALKTLTGIDAA